jgi:hypothetical protein
LAVHREQDYRRRVTDDRDFMFGPVRKFDAVDFDGEHPAREHDRHVSPALAGAELPEDPLEILWECARELDAPAVRGMREDQARRMKEWPLEVSDGPEVPGNATVHAAVERVADDWVADRAEVHANLMRAARMDRDSGQRQPAADRFRFDNARDGLSASPRTCRHFLPVDRIAADRCVDTTAGLDDTPHERRVFLLDLAVAELIGERFVGPIVLGDDHQPGSAAIQAVHNPGSPLPADSAQVGNVVEQRVHECPRLVTSGRMHHHPGRLVHDDEIAILVDDAQRQCLRCGDRLDRCGNLDGDNLSCFNRLVHTRWTLIDTDMSVPDEPLDLRSRSVGEDRDQEEIESLALALSGYGVDAGGHVPGRQAAFCLA